MSLIKKILNHSLWLLVGSFTSKLLVFLSNIIVARYTSPEIFGQYSLLKNTVSTLEGLISGSISTSAAKHVAEYKTKEKEFFSTYLSALVFSIIIFCFILSFPLLVFPYKMVTHFFEGETKLVPGLYIGATILFGMALSNLMQNILIGLELFKKIAWVSIIVSLISLPATFFLVVNYGLYGGLIGLGGYFLLDFISKSYVIFIKEKYQLSFNYTKILSQLKGIFFFSSYLFFSVCINAISFWYARIILLKDTSNFEVLGYFDAAFQLLSILYIITGTVTSAVLPKLSSAFSLKKTEELDTILKSSLLINFVFASVVALFFILFSETIMSLYGSEFVAGSMILTYLSISAIFVSIAYIFHRYLISVNKVIHIFYANLLSAISMFGFLYFKAPITGEILALSIVLYYIVTVFYYSFIVYFFRKKNKLEFA